MPGRTRRDRPHVCFERRRFLGWLSAPAIAALLPQTAHALAVQSARLWPAQEYTRLTIESAAAIAHEMLSVKNPERLVLDLQEVEVTAELQQLAARVGAGDPYIQSIRVAKNRPGVTRVVLDLKSEVKPQLFALKPVGEYGHRLVLDLYPLQPPDPLMALLEERNGGPVPVAGADANPAVPAGNASPGAQASNGSHVAPAGNGSPGAPVTGTSTASANTFQPVTGEPPRSAPIVQIRRAGPRPLIVVLDPGHGGEDPGAIGKRGTREKHVALAIARRLKQRIDGERTMRAMLTRDDDYFVPLNQRVAKARAVKADLFISIHADAFDRRDVRGSSVFALSERGATSAAARWLAQSENRADLIGGVNLDVGDPILARTLLDLSQTASITDSLKLGRYVLDEIGEVNTLHKNYVEQAGFAVLKAPDVPSILVETAFISNPFEEKRLLDTRYQQKLADSMLGGIRRYFAQNPPLARS